MSDTYSAANVTTGHMCQCGELHVPALDPPTVLALLDRIAAAEDTLAKVRALADEWETADLGWPARLLRAALTPDRDTEAHARELCASSHDGHPCGVCDA